MLYVSDSVLQIRSHYCSAMSATSSSDEGSDAYNLQDFEEISDENASDCSSGSENEFLSPPTGSIQGYAFDPQYTPAEMLEIDAQTNESAMESDEIEKSCSCESCPDEPISGKCCKENWPPNIRPSECLAKTEEFKTVISRAHIYVLHFEVNAGRMQDSERDPQNNECRYLAYRSLCWLIYQRPLGRAMRIPLPDCCVNSIRSAYPSEGGEYTGFKRATL